MQYLQQVRSGDRLIGELLVLLLRRHTCSCELRHEISCRDIPGELVIRNLILQDAHLQLILDHATNMFRMALVRRDHSACVTFECRSNAEPNLLPTHPIR